MAGLVRQTANSNLTRIEHLRGQGGDIFYGDLMDQSSIMRALEEFQPEEVYNLAAMSFVALSWGQPLLTAEFDRPLGVARVLEAIRTVNPKIRYYQASSSEMFGKVAETPQNEQTLPPSPLGPTACPRFLGTI